MAGKEAVDLSTFVSHSDAEDLDLEDDGSKPSETDVSGDEERKPPAKPAKKVVPPKDDEEEEDESKKDDEEEEEEDDGTPKKTAAEIQLEKKLSRTGQARERLETQLAEARAALDRATAERTDAGAKKLEAITAELDELYEKVEEARAAGRTGDASKHQRRIDEIRDNATRAQATFLAAREAMKATELRAYNTMAQELEYLDPRFNKDSDEFDQELLDDVGEAVDAYEAKGMALTDALRKACKLVLREDVFARGRSLKRDNKTLARPEPKKVDTKKNLDAAKRQPPDEPGTTKDRADAEIDMATISEADFAKLPQATLDRLLGNT